MIKKRPNVLSIAGFDPSGGAGVLADCKTFESQKTLGMGVASAITFQNEDDFHGLTWIAPDSIFSQLDILSEKHRWDYVKIGLIESLELLNSIAGYLHVKNNKCRIIWDPVLKASAGYVFHQSLDKALFESVCRKVFLITPNLPEIQFLYPDMDPLTAAAHLSGHCIVYLKGGHNSVDKGKDFLFENGKRFSVNPKGIAEYDKHGTGCVFSSALTANMARGYSLHSASLKAKRYVTKYMMSSKMKLGHHKI